MLCLFACVVIHEFGHALTAKRFGIVTRDITLYPIGGISSFEEMPEKPSQELLVAIVGPFVNLAIAAVIFIVLAVAGGFPSAASVEGVNDILNMPFLFGLMLANIVLAVFNLIPAFPMDGGRALRAFLSFWMDKVTATRIAAGLGQMLAIGFVFLGFFSNFWLVFIGLFIFLGAGSEVAFARMRSALSGLTTRDALMHRFTRLAPDASLGDAAGTLLNSQETAFVIDGQPVAILTKDDIIRGLTEAGVEGKASHYAVTEIQTVDADTPLSDLLQKVMRADQQVAVVLDAGQPIGLIDRENIEERMLIQEALRKRSFELGAEHR